MTASRDWTVWGLAASVVVTEPARLGAAARHVQDLCDAVDDSCSRFRRDSELSRLAPVLADGVVVSPLLAYLVELALWAAEMTDGDVDPTLGNDLAALGYDRDLASIPVDSIPVDQAEPDGALLTRTASRGAPGWRRVGIDAGVLTVPADVSLDLGATAKAATADLAARQIADALGCGVLVSLGGDIATAGPAPDGLWQVLVQDLDDDPGQCVALPAGCGMATSSTSKRRWHGPRGAAHHILDPRFGLPADPVWRSVTVAAESCLRANAYSTAAIVRGHAAVDWLRADGVSARLVDQRRRVVTTGAWPTGSSLAGADPHG
ncbi:FAD:protein FMN transferase [Specibacter cremeus]|uniref:FAD:protein FMN transferase n=1 Tax=Specibacter cremeus TaxID=1629051 RepID=UPI000F78D090|nr:FAD:protein FMN transferase [Specibacter cremeus]